MPAVIHIPLAAIALDRKTGAATAFGALVRGRIASMAIDWPEFAFHRIELEYRAVRVEVIASRTGRRSVGEAIRTELGGVGVGVERDRAHGMRPYVRSG